MKNIFKITIKCGLILSIFLCSLHVLSTVFRHGESTQGNNFRGFDDNTFDVLVLGSSHAQYSFNPAVFYNETGYYSYVLGTACQAIPVSYEYLKEALETQSPEIVLLEVFTALPDVVVCRTDGVTKLAGDEMTGLERYSTIWHIDNKKESLLEYWFDIIMTHSSWPEKELEDFKPAENEVKDVFMGHVTQMPDNYSRWELTQFEDLNTGTLKDKDLEYILKIKELCDQEGIRLILYKAPYVIEQASYDSLQALLRFAEENNIEYVNGFDHMQEMDFHLGMDGDAWHNNVWGARKMTEYLSKVALENNWVNYHEYNELTETSLKTGVEYSTPLFIQKIIDPYMLLDLASTYDCTVAIQYKGNPVSVIYEENDLLQSVGFTHDFIKDKRNDYFAVTVNGEEVASSKGNEIVYETNGHKLTVNQSGIYLDDFEFDTNSQMTIVILGNKLDWSESVNIDFSKRFWRKGYQDWYME